MWKKRCQSLAILYPNEKVNNGHSCFLEINPAWVYFTDGDNWQVDMFIEAKFCPRKELDASSILSKRGCRQWTLLLPPKINSASWTRVIGTKTCCKDRKNSSRKTQREGERQTPDPQPSFASPSLFPRFFGGEVVPNYLYLSTYIPPSPFTLRHTHTNINLIFPLMKWQ